MNTEQVLERMAKACQRCGRSAQEVSLMAVTKTHPLEATHWALEAGLKHLGENRVQELARKHPQVDDPSACWELIGPVQSNKARLAVEHADRIQTLDRLKLVNAFERHCADLGKARLRVLLQVNVGEDPAKHGCEVAEAASLVEAIQQTQHLELEGLMTIGELTEEEARIRCTFSRLRELRDRLSAGSGLALPVLSMGMTGDLEWAIEEGSTLIRVGTALFGARE
ncbi:YggS family pyridoxal phosphate-dependent enzyme [Oceanipulchritudo coccoides]|nr:YggS family pyridoxal phosphate-dependent enzyme [Oceanipulchritudo coccoides]